MALFSAVENHEFCVVALEQPLQELHADACESVAVGHHNFCDSAATDGVQKGEEAGPMPVETTANVLDKLVVGIGALEIGTLALKVGTLVLAADMGVRNATAWLRLFVTGDPKECGDVGEAGEPFAFAALTADDLYFTLFCPATKRACADIVDLTNWESSKFVRKNKKMIQN